jgi:hypothetical protein
MKAFYTKLINTFCNDETVELFTAKGVPAVRHLDIYKGQYLFAEDFEQLILPALLVEFTINHQTRKANISIHCCWEQVAETSAHTADINTGLLYLDWLDIVYSLLHHLESEHTGKLELISEGMRDDDSPVYVHVFNFECSYMGRVIPSYQHYNEATGEKVTTTGTIKPVPPEGRLYDF